MTTPRQRTDKDNDMARNRPTATEGHPILQWHNGKTTAKAGGAQRFAEGFVGFTVEAERWGDFDAQAHELSIPRVEIRHRRPGGTEVKAHWDLGDSLRVYPLTAGPTRATMYAATRAAPSMAEQAGIVAVWDTDEQGRGYSRLALWVLPTLASLVIPLPLVLTVRSRMTDNLFAALLDHCTRVCEQADALLGAETMPWHIALPLVAGPEADFGKGDTTTVTPIASGHQPQVTTADLEALGLPPELADLADDLAEQAKAWAVDELAAEPAEPHT
jgi:hypothetical protein